MTTTLHESGIILVEDVLDAEEVAYLSTIATTAAPEKWNTESDDVIWGNRLLVLNGVITSQVELAGITEKLIATFKAECPDLDSAWFTGVGAIQRTLPNVTIPLSKPDRNEGEWTMLYGMVVYLNDDYEGGETWFPAFKVKTKPTPGSVVIYPYGWKYQQVNEPVTGETPAYFLTMFAKKPSSLIS